MTIAMKTSLLLVVCWLSNLILVVESKGYLGKRVESSSNDNVNGLGGSRRPKRSLVLASKSKGRREVRRQMTRKERNLKKHVTKIFYDDDTVDYHDDTYDDDDDDDYSYTYSSNAVRGKAMGMMGMMGMGMWQKKHDSSHYPHSDFYPSARDIAFLDDQFFDDHFFEDDDCELVAFNETFGMSSADLFLAPDTTVQDPGNPSYPGTVFLFEREYLLGPGGVSAGNGTSVSGSCTRTESGNDGNGAGLCTFIFVDDEGFSINVNGLLVGPLGGKLAVTGGTGGLVGVIGEMDFLPIYEDGKTIGDIFLDPIRYEVMAELGLIVCP